MSTLFRRVMLTVIFCAILFTLTGALVAGAAQLFGWSVTPKAIIGLGILAVVWLVVVWRATA